MPNQNFTIKKHNGTSWDELYPKTVPAQVQTGVNNRFVTDAEKAVWSAKQAALGFTAENFANKNQANGYVGLDAGSKINASYLPAIAITDTFVVANQAAMLALTAEVGDIAVRTDLNKSFILKTAGASTLANWQELLTPTDVVVSVAGKTGAVTLTPSDVNLGNVANENKATMLTSPALTGTPTTPTAAIDTNTTQIASTAFVLAQAGAAAPAMSGAATVGTSTRFARQDHIHPTDTNRASTSIATTGANGLMSSTDKTKLDSVSTGAEVNQNTFSNVAVSGQTTVVADSKTDTLTLVGGTGITITTDAITDTVTITAQGGQAPANHANQHITTGIDIIPNAVASGNAGLMSGADKTKLDGIATSANNYTHPANHTASIITQDVNNRFVTDAEKVVWSAKQKAITVSATVAPPVLPVDGDFWFELT